MEDEWGMLFIKCTENKCAPDCRKLKNVKDNYISFCRKYRSVLKS